jgi:hypothetical protein
MALLEAFFPVVRPVMKHMQSSSSLYAMLLSASKQEKLDGVFKMAFSAVAIE